MAAEGLRSRPNTKLNTKTKQTRYTRVRTGVPGSHPCTRVLLVCARVHPGTPRNARLDLVMTTGYPGMTQHNRKYAGTFGMPESRACPCRMHRAPS